MAWNRRDGSPYRVRNLLAALDARGIDQPAPVADAVAVLDRIEDDKPAEPEQLALHDAIVAGATPDELNAVVLAELGSHRIRTAFEQARLTAAVDVLRAVLDSRHEIHEHLAAQAAGLIEKLEAIAALDDAKLDTLIREGRHDDARLLADKEIVGQELSELHQLRDLYLTPPGVEVRPSGVDCTIWVDPRKAPHLHGDTRADVFLDGIRKGAQLHYPSAEQAAEAAAPIARRMAQEAQERKESQHGLGFLAV